MATSKEFQISDLKDLTYEDLTYEKVMDIVDKKAYGDFKVWHVLFFLIVGPMLNWPMMIMLLVLAFSSETINLFKGVRSSPSNNG